MTKPAFLRAGFVMNNERLDLGYNIVKSEYMMDFNENVC